MSDLKSKIELVFRDRANDIDYLLDKVPAECLSRDIDKKLEELRDQVTAMLPDDEPSDKFDLDPLFVSMLKRIKKDYKRTVKDIRAARTAMQGHIMLKSSEAVGCVTKLATGRSGDLLFVVDFASAGNGYYGWNGEQSDDKYLDYARTFDEVLRETWNNSDSEEEATRLIDAAEDAIRKFRTTVKDAP